jgi:N-formylglutamate amidohydrolase
VLKNSVKNVYKLFEPEIQLPLIFDSPHSGRIYPKDFNYSCEFEDLVRAEDNYVDDLFLCAPEYGGTLLCSLFPRTYIDVNRARNDLDLEVLDGTWPHHVVSSHRAQAGIGLIRRLIKPGTPVYNRRLSTEETAARIRKYYDPYHQTLKELIDNAHYKFGEVWHINCHSMPYDSVIPSPKKGRQMVADNKNPDFVIGDRDGTSSDPDFSHSLKDFLSDLGYKVTINKPYKGVELVKRYSNPEKKRHSIQIEINKALYWDEEKLKKNSGYGETKITIEKMIEFCANYAQSSLTNIAAD